jgi:hypothetical protein
MPVFHDCQRCTACCRWPGQVRLTEAEITRIAAFLQLSEHDFIQRYTRCNTIGAGSPCWKSPAAPVVFDRQ